MGTIGAAHQLKSVEAPGFGNASAVYLHDLVDRAAARRPSAPAIRDSEGSWTFADLDRWSRAAHTWLVERGIRPGDRVLVRAASTRLTIALLFGASRCGAVFVPVHAEMKWYSLRQVIGDCTPSLLVGGPGDDDLDDIQVPSVLMDDLGEVLATTDAAHPQRDDASPAETAVLLYTSGSTAAPKAVVCPHSAILFAAHAIDEMLGYRPDDVVFNRFSLSWDPGLYKVFICLANACELVLAGEESDLRLLSRMQEVGATVVPLVPSLAALLVTLAGRKGSANLPVRMFTNTGAALPPATADALRRLFPGAVVVRQFGQTECKRVSIMPVSEEHERPESVGLPLPGTSVLILSETGNVLPPGEIGEIVVEGPHLMSGYWRAPGLTEQTYRRDLDSGRVRLHTGDYGYCDPDGYLYFEGRRDDMFKRKGVRVSTFEIEGAALDIPAVRAALAIPPTEDRDLALVVEGDITREQLQRELAARLEIPKQPGVLLVADRLPTSANGKYSRQMASQLFNQVHAQEEYGR